MSLGSNGVDRVHSLRKIPMRLHGTSALIAHVQPILHRVLCSNETLPNPPKHYEILQNMSLVPMGGSSAFFAKNSDATLWHKLVH